MNFISNQFKNYPLRTIMIIALFVRLLSAIYSKGYGMHDDHFLIIESSKSWVDGTDFNNWLPQNQEHPKATGHNLLYIGIHYLLFALFKFLGLSDPQFQMLIIRILHACFSLLIVYYSYRITKKLSNEETAIKVGLMLALLWFLPFMSVRNLVEIVSIPLLLAGVWLLIRESSSNTKLTTYLLAGLIMSVAVSIRYQTLIFVGGVGLALLFQQKFKEAVMFGIGSILSIALIQGGIDLLLWGKPFEELKEYVLYNLKFKNAYGTNNYLMYFEVILGFLIPPVSLFLFFGFFKVWKKHLLLFLPTILFLAFHTYFPNKQERFIFTIIPFIIILGWIGWNEFVLKSEYWKNHAKLLKNCYIFFWIINLTILPFVSLSSTKLSRVEAMYALYPDIKNIHAVLIDDSEKIPAVMMPVFYSGKPVMVYSFERGDIPTLGYTNNKSPYLKYINHLDFFSRNPEAIQPEYVIFTDGKKLNERIEKVKKYFPRLLFIKKIEPSNIDQIMRKLNPNNKNEEFYIYKTNIK